MKVQDAGIGMQSVGVMGWKRWFAVSAVVGAMAAAGFSQTASQAASQANQRPNRITQEVTSGAVVTVAGMVHPLTRRATDLGAVNSGMQLGSLILNIGLSGAQQTELEALLAAQQDPKSPQYHQWLTQEEYGARFGLTDSDLNKVTGWLGSQGLTVTRVSKSRNAVYFSGQAWQVESAFHTQLHQYQLDGEMHFANATEIRVPAGIASVLLNVRGLNNFRLKPQVRKRAAPAYTVDTTKGIVNFMTPADWATIYGVNAIYSAGYDGTGAHVGVVGQTYAPIADINTFRSASGLGAAKVSYVCIDPVAANCTGTYAIAPSSAGDLDEADLDIEWAGGVAKNATVDFVYAPYSDACTNSACTSSLTDPFTGSSYGVFDALQHAVEDYTIPPSTTAVLPVISMSYTDCEYYLKGNSSYVQWVTAIGQEANSQGQTIVVASGDSGAFGCDQGNYPAKSGVWASVPVDSPNYTGVGGTTLSGDLSSPATYWNQTLNLVDSVIGYIPETVWNDTAADGSLEAGSGGVSQVYGQPTWQPTPANYTGTAGRFVPDVAFAASPNHDGYMTCSAGNNSTQYGNDCTTGFVSSLGYFDVAGGTSAGTPSFAGMLTLLTQKFGPLGNINPTLYGLATASNYSTIVPIFNATTGGNSDVPCTVAATDPGCVGSSFGYSVASSFPYYNLATGLGSVNGGALYSALGGLTKTSISVAASPSSVALNQTFSLVLTATVTPTSATGTVSFAVNGTTLGSAPLSSGTAVLTTPVTASVANGFSAGSDVITASYSGDANDLVASGTTALVVNGVGTATAVTAAPNVLAISATPMTTTLSATVNPTSGSGIISEGTVTFTVGSGGMNVGTAAVSNGLATLNVAVTALHGFSAGTDTIAANYSGDATYAASNGGTSVTLPGYTITQPGSPAAIKAGGSTAVTLTLTSVDGYTGAVSFPASNISVSPATSNLTVSASPVTWTGTGGTSTVTITTSTSAANHAPAVPWKSGGAVLFCAVLLGAPFTLKRKRATLAVLLTALTISLAGFLISCGGGGSSTPAAHTYTVTLTPSGSGTVTNPAAVAFVVTVQ